MTYRSNLSEFSPLSKKNKENNISFYFKKIKINKDIKLTDET